MIVLFLPPWFVLLLSRRPISRQRALSYLSLVYVASRQPRQAQHDNGNSWSGKDASDVVDLLGAYFGMARVWPSIKQLVPTADDEIQGVLN